MQIVDDAIVTLHSEGPILYATRHVLIDGETVQEVVELYSGGSWVSPAALSESENVLIAMFATRDGFFVSLSYDAGVSWGEAQWVGDTPVGAAVPTSCLWHEEEELNAMLAWVAPEHQGDGGPLYIATFIDNEWEVERVSDLPYLSSPSLACDAQQQSMIIRSEESVEKTGDIDVYFLKREDGVWTQPEYVIRGADPHLAVCDGDYWVGYHDVGANRLYSSDGGETWEEWKPAGDEQGQQISVTDVKDGVVAIFWRTEEGLQLKTY
jgi:hypothetical protein